ncbi:MULTISPECIES: nitrate- and nitrite sensing domain-containing protein [Streptacidiphilus]|uniref:histidine kinase n=1 Tax=Streptacidiphilus cavernicola TaxID=3342716 RepID=A0ABV6UYT0_9ACTN|nr:nitrate- and nitrite sensing domain-containing protein [Streptacidiphilus jeojiense]
MRQKQADPGPRQAESQPVDGGGSSWAFRHWRVPTRLTAIVLVPVVTGLVFAGLRVKDQLDLASTAGQNEKVAVLVRDATTVAEDMQNERDLAVIPQMRGIQNDPKVLAARKQTDADIAVMDADAAQVKPDLQITTDLKNFHDQAAKNLATLRAKGNDVRSTTFDPVSTEVAYSNIYLGLLGLDNELAFGDKNINSRGRELFALSLEKESTATERNLVTIALMYDKMPSQLADAIQVAARLTQVSEGQVLLSGVPADLKLYQQTVIGQGVSAAENTLLGMAGKSSLKSSGITPASWYALASQKTSEERKVETTITDQVVADAHQAKQDANQQAITISAEALALVLIAGALAYLMGRSMVRGMRTLRDSAIDIASERLPDLVRKLSKTDPERVDTTVRPIPLSGRDEIGDVARAFDDVHREAIRLASEQAMLRGNVNAIFTNLSRRSQSLIERQLSLITDLENNEADPDQLENLFKLDHLATRMRRNGENLLVLAGESAGREWSDPIPLVDVLRAAASEVEQYERIELSGIPETDVIGPAVTDLVHLLAELLENATTFSSPQTRVKVTATRLPDQRVLVEIHDKGIGLTAADFAEINAKLADPPTVDASVSRQMGLFVVGRLAERHAIRVQLRPSGESAGTTSLVMVPDHLTQLPRAAEPEEQFTVSRIYGEPEAGPYAETDQRTASELGFDDSRYDRPAVGAPGAGAPDLMQRTMRLGQRREQAALEGPAEGAPAAQQPQQPTAPQQPAAQQPGPAPQPAGAYEPYPDSYVPEFDGFDSRPAAASYPAPDAGYEAGSYTAADFDSYGPGNGAVNGQQYQPEPSYDTSQFSTAQYGQDPYVPEQYPAYQQDQYGHQQYPDNPSETQYGHPYYSETPQPAPAPAPEAPVAPLPPTSRPDTARPAAANAPAALPQRPTSPVPSPSANPANGALPTRRPGQALGGGRAIGDREAGERPNWFTGARDDGEPGAPAMPGAPLPPVTPAEPVAGGTTPAGLPRRVPRQNLLPGNVQESSSAAPDASPQLSRSPEEVRGRLTNLRRGIQQGHNAGDTPSPDQHGAAGLFGGPNHPER